MTFLRLTRGDLIAGVAALLLLLVMAMDWYGTKQGDEARRIQRLSEPEEFQGPEGRQVSSDVGQRAEERAEAEERNAWQASAFVDRLLLVTMLAAIAWALLAAALRAAGRRTTPPLTPSALAAGAALLGALLVVYRLMQKPGFDEAATIKPGAPLGLLTLGLLAYGAASALQAEEEGTAWKEPGAPMPAGGDGAEPVGADGAESAQPAAESAEPAASPAEGAEPAAEPLTADAAPAEAAPASIASRLRPAGRRRLTARERERIVELARTDPAELGKPFRRWSAPKLAEHLIESGEVESIAPDTVRRILRQSGVALRR